MRTIRRTEYGLRAKQYQIVAVDGFVEDKEYDVSNQGAIFRNNHNLFIIEKTWKSQ